MGQRVNVWFDADTSRYITHVGAAEGATEKLALSAVAAKNAILDCAKSEIKSAQEKGASAEDLARIEDAAAKAIAKTWSDNGDKQLATFRRVTDGINAQSQAYAALGAMKRRAAAVIPETHELPARSAISGTIRLGEGQDGLRAVETFLAMSPMVGKVIQGLFPLVGGIAFGKMLVDIGEKGVTAFEKIEKAAEASREAFEEEHDKALVSIGDKEIENQKLQDQIDLLSHHPDNGLASEMLNLKAITDALVVSLEAENNQLDEIFKKNSVGYFGSIVGAAGFGPTGTKSQEGELSQDRKDLTAKVKNDNADYYTQLAGLRYDGNDPKLVAESKAKIKALTDSSNAKIQGLFQGVVDKNNAEIGRLEKETSDRNKMNDDAYALGGSAMPVIDNSHKISNLRGDNRQLTDFATTARLDSSIYEKKTTLASLKPPKSGDGAAEAAQKAVEAQKKKMEAYISLWKTLAPVTSKAIYDYWKQQKDAIEDAAAEALKKGKKAPAGSQELIDYITEKMGPISQEGAAKTHAAIAKFQKSQRNAPAAWDGRTVNVMGNTAETSASLKRAQTDSRLAESENEAQMKASAIAADLASGAISKLEAEQKLAAINAGLHAQRIADLNAQLLELQKTKSYNPVTGMFASDKDNQAALAIQDKIAKESASAYVEAMKSASEESAQMWQTAFKQSMSLWVQDATDSAKQVTAVALQALNGVNGDIADLMVDGKGKNGLTAWKTFRNNLAGTTRGVGKTLADDGLKRLEAAGLGKLGIAHKADGSKANPYYVVDANGMAAKPSGIFGALYPNGAPSMPNVTGQGESATSGFVKTAIGILGTVFGGGKALGGAVMPGVAYDVGELGRERFVPKVPGTIIPSNQLGGGAAHYTINVADGVTPEQMAMHVQTALRQFHPRVVRDSVSATQDRQARLPSTRG